MKFKFACLGSIVLYIVAVSAIAQSWDYRPNPDTGKSHETMCISPSGKFVGGWQSCYTDGTCNNAAAIKNKCQERASAGLRTGTQVVVQHESLGKWLFGRAGSEVLGGTIRTGAFLVFGNDLVQGKLIQDGSHIRLRLAATDDWVVPYIRVGKVYIVQGGRQGLSSQDWERSLLEIHKNPVRWYPQGAVGFEESFSLRVTGESLWDSWLKFGENDQSPIQITERYEDASSFRFSVPVYDAPPSPAPTPPPPPPPPPPPTVPVPPSGPAQPTPTLRTSVPGSAIFFYVDNQTERGYNCTITYSYSWDDFGTRKSRADQSSFSVPGRFNGQVLRVNQNAPNVALDSANLSCN